MTPLKYKGLHVLLSLLICSVHAVSNVTVVPLPETCESYPGFNSTTGEAGPFIPVGDATDSPIDGLEVMADYVTTADDSRWGFVSGVPKSPPASPPESW